jgi:hypothetical protein
MTLWRGWNVNYREVAREFVVLYQRQQECEADIPFLLRSVIWVNGTGYYPMAAEKLYKQFTEEFKHP